MQSTVAQFSFLIPLATSEVVWARSEPSDLISLQFHRRRE
jgi:hypothetical protein